MRVLFALLGLFLCYRLGADTARGGAARLLSTIAVFQLRVDTADLAVSLSPRDPETHYNRALMLVNLGRLNEAAAEFKNTVDLRPHHYYEWLDLGVTLDRLDNQTGAESALRESIRLAPFFPQPRWQLGNLLFRQGRYDDAFTELRFAARNNRSLIDQLMELGWVAAGGDVQEMKRLIEPTTKWEHLLFARFLAIQEKGTDAVSEINETGEPQNDPERKSVNETISFLLYNHQFREAYSAWQVTHRQFAGHRSDELLNGDFTQSIVVNEPGFGWQIQEIPNVTVSIDTSGPDAKARSLQLQFSGLVSSSGALNQLVLLSAKSRYSLSFMARTQDLVSGGPPAVLVMEAASSAKVLARSKPISTPTSDWTSYTVEFRTEENNGDVNVVLGRVPCSQQPCPIFGKLWLSEFKLIKL
jgi:Flp pilus assembly protein TadD